MRLDAAVAEWRSCRLKLAQRAVRALKGVNAEQPAVIQSAYAGLMKPAQEALQKALASA